MRPIFVVLLVLTGILVHADVPHQLSYQGRLTDSGTAVDTTVDITFRIFSSGSDGTLLWEEMHSDVVISDGLFDVLLGSVNAIGSSVFDGTARYLEVEIDGVVAGDRTALVSVAHAYRAVQSDTAQYAHSAGDAIDGPWQREGNHYVGLDNSDDSVGLGTLFPAAKLHVEGDILLDDGGDLRFGFGDTRLNYYQNDLLIHSEDEIRLLSPSEIKLSTEGGLDWGFVNPTARTIGLGTDSPSEMLHLYTDDSNERAFVKIEAAHFSNWGEAGLRIETPQNRWHLRMDDDSNNNLGEGALGLRSQDGSIEAMTWTENGNVGIATTDPDERLDVNGNVEVSGDVGAGGVLSAGSITGDYAANSINRSDIVDEVGLASSHNGSETTLDRNSFTAILERSITVPDPGWVVAIGLVELYVDHGASDATWAQYGFSSFEDSLDADYRHNLVFKSNADAGEYTFTCPSQRLFYASAAGAYTYYLVAKQGPDNEIRAFMSRMDLLYIPTSYASKDGGSVMEDHGDYGTAGTDVLGSGEMGPSISDMAARIETLERRLAELEAR